MRKLILFLLLFSAPCHAAVSYIGAGAASMADNAAVSPAVHASTAAGDFLVILGWVADPSSGVLACPATYTTRAAQATWNNTNVAGLVVCTKIAAGGDGTTVAYASGEATDRVGAQVATFRGHDATTPVNVLSATPSTGLVQNTLGAITAITPTAANGAVIVFGAKNTWWTSVATLSGDGLTWAEIGDPNHSSGDGSAAVWDYALWTGAAPTLTDKTFTITGDGQSGHWVGGMMSLNAAATVKPAWYYQMMMNSQVLWDHLCKRFLQF